MHIHTLDDFYRVTLTQYIAGGLYNCYRDNLSASCYFLRQWLVAVGELVVRYYFALINTAHDSVFSNDWCQID